MLRWLGVVLLVFPLFGACLRADGGGLELPSPTLVVTGRAAIYHEDLAGARERAVSAALVRGLERYAGLRIESSTLIKKGVLIDREVRAHTQGYVSSFEILDSRRDGSEFVVEVRLTVSEKPVEESFRRLASATTTLLLVRERNLGESVKGQIVPAVLADTFFTSQVSVPPPDQLQVTGKRLSERFFQAPDSVTGKELGLRAMAGLLVVAWAATRPLESGADAVGYAVDPAVLRPVVAAEGSVTILSGLTGQVIAARRFDDVRASDAADAERAGLRALGDLSVRMRDFVVAKLSEYVAELGFPLRVVVRGEAARDGARRVARILEATRWVERVELVREEDGETQLLATCREKGVYVVEELRQAPEVRVVRFEAAAGEVEVR